MLVRVNSKRSQSSTRTRYRTTRSEESKGESARRTRTDPSVSFYETCMQGSESQKSCHVQIILAYRLPLYMIIEENIYSIIRER